MNTDTIEATLMLGHTDLLDAQLGAIVAQMHATCPHDSAVTGLEFDEITAALDSDMDEHGYHAAPDCALEYLSL